MDKQLSPIVLGFIFIGLLFGSYAMWSEIRMPSSSSQETETENQASVIVDEPEALAAIASPVTVSGKARGYWFFEASFPIEIIDGNGTVLGIGIAQAQDEWMTEGYVPFSTAITFTEPGTDTGFIIFKKDNPSGLPEHDATVAVPIIFAQ